MLDLPEEDYQKELVEIKKGAELQWQADRDEANKKALQQLEIDEKLQKQKEENDKLQAELKVKKDEEEKQRQAQEELESAPDKEKIKDLVNRLKEFELPDVKSKKAKGLILSTRKKLDELVELINGTKI